MFTEHDDEVDDLVLRPADVSLQWSRRTMEKCTIGLPRFALATARVCRSVRAVSSCVTRPGVSDISDARADFNTANLGGTTLMRPKSSGGRAAIALIVVLVLAASAFAVWTIGRNSSWWGTSDAQRQLLADPMADRNLAGLQLQRSDESAAVGPLGKPQPPAVHHWFLLSDTPQSTLAHLGDLATSSGWQQQVDLSNDTTWIGRKSGASGDVLQLVMRLEKDGTPQPTPESANSVRVSLTSQHP